MGWNCYFGEELRLQGLDNGVDDTYEQKVKLSTWQQKNEGIPPSKYKSVI